METAIRKPGKIWMTCNSYRYQEVKEQFTNWAI
jgi:hypothetical protein